MIPYVGGKSFLASWIISEFPKDFETRTYVEVFGGGGWVLFKKPESFLEVYNDLNKDLVTMFKIIRDNYPEFQHRMQWTLHSREMYAEARKALSDDKFLDEMERAMNYAISKVQSFAGKGGWGYQVTANKVISGKWMPFIKRLELINARLKKVQIECLDYAAIIKKYDGENTLFYLDPPYYGAEAYYDAPGVYFREENHVELAEILRGIKGKFVLSYYDNPEIKRLYKGFRTLKKGSVKHSCGAVNEKRTGLVKPKTVELLIMNF